MPIRPTALSLSRSYDFNKAFRNLRKVEILLKQFESMKKRVDYWALDLSLEELKRTFAEVSPQTYQYVQLKGLHGTYDDAVEWLKDPENRKQPTCVVSLGSSIGNFNRQAAAEFLNRYARLLGPADSMIVGLDSCKDKDRVYSAYNDSQGVTHRFYLNGLVHANEVLGYEAFKLDQWTIDTSYNETDGCHRAYYVPTQDVSINGIQLHKGDKVVFEEAYKYDVQERDHLWRRAGLINVAALGNATDDYRKSWQSSPHINLQPFSLVCNFDYLDLTVNICFTLLIYIPLGNTLGNTLTSV